ncbi:C-type lectin domain family 4 member M-like [Anabas testudineus]|uniref:C-type lectin domain-containing protein n=1 Tax=Anabas testudineus TaxID=64144 RepID=A0A3Q1HYR0_ANATE|nr:C-type lectin domain family 4 member M-like [Anabas testudineus]
MFTGKMVGHQWLPWINNPAPGSSVSVTSAKQEQELCSLRSRKILTCSHLCPLVVLSTLCLLLLVSCAALSVLYTNESDRKPEWKNLSCYQNMSASYLTLTKANTELKKENEILKKLRVALDEETTLLNQTAAQLMSANLALTLENSELMEKIVNLSSANLQLIQKHEKLVQLTSEQEEQKLNLSQTIEYLVMSNSQKEEEKRRLFEANGLLTEELFQLKETNQELVEINDRLQGLSKRVTELQELNQNLSTTLVKEKEEAAEQEKSSKEEMEQVVVDVQLMNEAYHSLDLYCPVVNQKTRERLCKKCDNSWKQFQMRCYYFSSRKLSWSSSRAWCQTQGGDLLIVNSEEEQRFIFDASQAQEQSSTRLWIGLTDVEEEGDWRWVDGSKVTSDLQFWLSRAGTGTEPDDWKLDDPLGEDCGHIDMSEHALKSWMDGSCEMPYRWICEKNI